MLVTRPLEESLNAGSMREDPSITQAFSAYRVAYTCSEPDCSKIQSPSEVRDVTGDAAVRILTPPPIASTAAGSPPIGSFSEGEGKHIWVITKEVIPYALESGELGKTIEGRGRLAHTNLTGGEAAYCGGEAWFSSPTKVFLTGGSGRYPPKSKEELQCVVDSFQNAGFEVHSAGWSDGIALPARYFHFEEEL